MSSRWCSARQEQYVWDADGNQYLDFFGGIVTVSVGHCNDRSTRKCTSNSTRCSTSRRCSPTSRRPLWRRRSPPSRRAAGSPSVLHQQRHGGQRDAILAARCYTGNTEIVALRHSITGVPRWRWRLPAKARGGWAAQAGIVHAHNAYCYRCPFGLTYPNCEVKCAQDMEELIARPPAGASPVSSASRCRAWRLHHASERVFPNHRRNRAQPCGIFISDEVQTAGPHGRQVVRHRTVRRRPTS